MYVNKHRKTVKLFTECMLENYFLFVLSLLYTQSREFTIILFFDKYFQHNRYIYSDRKLLATFTNENCPPKSMAVRGKQNAD